MGFIHEEAKCANRPSPSRLRSLDALRGFDMFWIIGGGSLLGTFIKLTDWPFLDIAYQNLVHSKWNGFTAWDLVFPLFIFLSGVSAPYSLTKNIENGARPGKLVLRIISRGLILVCLGVIYNGFFTFDLENLRYASVLGRIGLAYTFGALIVIYTGAFGQLLALVAILLSYWGLLALVSVPAFGAGDFAPGANLTDWIDQQFLPGRFHFVYRDSEGILSTLPAIGTFLLGALAGHWLRREDSVEIRKAIGLLGAGVCSLVLGAVWDVVFPINKSLWTSSFVLWSGGWSLILMATFYLVIDVLKFHALTLFFTVIGANAIAAYLLDKFIDFRSAAELILIDDNIHHGLLLPAGLSLHWVVLYLLYRNKIFLRV